ncbi:MDR family MFS transporter [Lacisediminimonas profundi]|uniref:MDR family MFS transporter n=1 Tax=Lacisediminimonas profundi TaxID=2603856 RepID=UPI00124B6163|nr:MDR family MFS transporter [Lacisediminimonas profundi]
MSSPSPSVPHTEFSPQDIRKLLTGLMLALLMAALDQTIVAVALPRISTELQGFELLAWVVSGYLIAAAVATPIYGKLGDMYGRRVMMVSAIWIFLLASVACALATSMPMLVAARILQGIGGGGLFSVTQAAVADVVTPRERGRYQAYFSATYATASVAGPVLGGMLTEYLSWQWIFWINLPLGAAALIVTRDSLRRLPVPHIRHKVDYLGALLLCTGLGAGMTGFTRIGQGAAWLSDLNVALFLVALVMLGLFIFHQLRTEHPILPLALFRIPVVALCLGVLFFSFSQLIAVAILVPLRSQMVAGMAASQSALQLVPLTLGSPFGAFLGGMLIGRTGKYKPAMIAGTCILPLALTCVALIDPANMLLSSIALAITGFSVGILMPTALVAIQHAVPRAHIGIATASTTFARQLGASIVVAVVTAVLMGALADTGAGSALALSGAEMMKELVGATLDNMPPSERMHLAKVAAGAFERTILVCAGLTLISLLLVWRLPGHVLHDRSE